MDSELENKKDDYDKAYIEDHIKKTNFNFFRTP